MKDTENKLNNPEWIDIGKIKEKHPHVEILLDRKFERWKVLAFSHTYNGRSYWLCQCDCGTIRPVEACQLKRGTSRSCGCINKEYLSNRHPHNFEDLTGKKFNKLTVIGLDGRDRYQQLRWKCLCDCGNYSVVTTATLKAGNTRSCGCAHLEAKLIDLTGLETEAYIVIKKVRCDTHNRKRVKWECVCKTCGNHLILEKYAIVNRPPTKGCRNCYGLKMRRENHPMWDHSLSEADRQLNGTRQHLPEISQWRKSVYERDQYICQITGKKGKICAHHLEAWHSNKELRFVVDNGITLLQFIHRYFHKLYGRTNNTRVQFEEFKELMEKEDFSQFK